MGQSMPMMQPEKFTTAHGELAITTIYEDTDGNQLKKPLTMVQDHAVVLQVEDHAGQFTLVLSSMAAARIGHSLLEEANEAVNEHEDDQERMEVDITLTVSDVEAWRAKHGE